MSRIVPKLVCSNFCTKNKKKTWRSGRKKLADTGIFSEAKIGPANGMATVNIVDITAVHSQVNIRAKTMMTIPTIILEIQIVMAGLPTWMILITDL